MKRNNPLRAAVVASAIVLVLAACGSDSDSDSGSSDAPTDTATEVSAASLTMSDAWSRQPAEGQSVGAVYGVASNPTDADIRIVSATSPSSDDVQLHETTVADDGVMSMSEVEEGFVVPAGGEFVFERGGPHIMLLDIDTATFPTDEVEVTLATDSGDTLSFTAPIEAIGDDMDTEDEAMEDEAMEDSDS